MAKPALSAALLAALRKLDTPTVCNALELAAPERRGFGYTVDPLVCAAPELPAMVGYARTATLRAVQPSALAGAEAKARRLAYYEYVASGPGPTIMVIQDLDGARAGYGAWWGEVNTAIHKGLGCLGCVTDGSIRDLDMLAPGFQLLAGQVGPSHAFVHCVDFGTPVNVAGMAVRHGDLLHADQHGAVIVPEAVAGKVVEAAGLLARREAVMLKAARAKGFNLDKLRRAMADADEIH
ncbi:MAG: RraA family protein [Alphaproteobacteria bacterium]|nr:RraA family protein [Alphaproteobacteria bacterium]